MGDTKRDDTKMEMAIFSNYKYIAKHGEDKAKKYAAVIVMGVHSLHDDKATQAYDG